MKIVFGVVILVLLTIGAQSAFAISDYQSGFQFGVSDGMGSCIPPHHCGSDEYITHLGSSFAFHSPEFNRGYVAGWCSVNPPHSGSDFDPASWDCDKGPDSAGWYTPHQTN